jgi:hypothetical protein
VAGRLTKPGFEPPVARHLATLQELTAPGGPIDTNSDHATHKLFRGSREGEYTRDRKKLHKKMIDDFFQEHAHVPQGHQAMILSGPPGAGKSTALRERIPDHKTQWMTIDPDEFKKRLLRHAIKNNYLDKIIPPEVHQRIRAGEKFAPSEFAGGNKPDNVRYVTSSWIEIAWISSPVWANKSRKSRRHLLAETLAVRNGLSPRWQQHKRPPHRKETTVLHESWGIGQNVCLVWGVLASQMLCLWGF